MKTITVLLFVVLSTPLFSQGSWERISPLPTSNDLSDVFFISPQKGWMVGSRGTIIATTDGGETWQWQYKADEMYFNSVFFIDENEGWVCGWDNILHTVDGGIYWEEQDAPGPFDVETVRFINPDTGIIVGTYNTIYKTVDGGANWTTILSGGTNSGAFTDLVFTDDLHGVGVGGYWFSPGNEAFCMVTEDGGDTWTETSPDGKEELISVFFVSQDTGWACGYENDILKTTDGGYTWDSVASFYTSKHDICFFNSMHGIILTNFSVLVTSDGGNTWSEKYIQGNPSLNAFSFVDSIGFAGGYHGAMRKTADFGVTWEYAASQEFGTLEDLCFADSLIGWARTSSGSVLYKTNDGGQNWESVDIGSSEILSGLSFPSPNTGYALGYHHLLYKTTDSGLSWQEIDLGTDAVGSSLYFVNELKGFIGGYYGNFLKTTDGGLSWTPINLMSYGSFVDIDFLDVNLGWVINSTGAVYSTNDGGNSWAQKSIGGAGNLNDVCFINEQTGFVTSLMGSLYMTENAGDSWNEVYSYSPYSNRARLDFANENEGWMIVGSRLYCTTNGGYDWNYHSFLSYMTDIHFLNSTTGWIAGSYSLILKYHKNFTGIDQSEQQTFSVYPNPASDNIHIHLPQSTGHHALFRIYDLQGKLFRAINVSQTDGEISISLSGIPKGIYMVELKTATGSQVMKIIKQ